MEGAAVGLSSWEHEILGRIAKELSRSDPTLASLVTGFNRLTASETMPSRPRLPVVRRNRHRGGYRRRARHARTSRLLMAVWFLTTAMLIAVALVLNVFTPGSPGNRACAQSRSANCAGNELGALSVLLPGLRS